MTATMRLKNGMRDMKWDVKWRIEADRVTDDTGLWRPRLLGCRKKPGDTLILCEVCYDFDSFGWKVAVVDWVW